MKRSYQLIPNRRRSAWRLRTVVAFALVMALLAGVFVAQAAYVSFVPVSSSAQKQHVTIELGTSVPHIAQQLQSAGLIRSAQVFEWYVVLHNYRGKLQAGTYSLAPNQSLATIADIIAHGKVATDLVTILPGQRLDQVREMFIKSGFSATDVDAALVADQYRAGMPVMANLPASASLEGFLYPDSYQKTGTTDPKEIIKEALSEMQQHLTPAVVAGFSAHNLSIFQGVTLASVVEQEVPAQTDRDQVAQVFLKRLAAGMPLGSDVTAYYGAIKDGAALSISYDTPYNTRLHGGLPIGPIASINDSALTAVAHPASTDWLYFVTGDDGVTHYAHTLDEHNANIAKYCHTLCSQTL